MKKYSLVQVNFSQGPTTLNSYHLPYSAGLLSAYTKSLLDNKWQLNKLIWRRESIESVAQSLKDDCVVGLSVYVWNREYNYALANRIKELNPNCIIVLGGPEPAVNDPLIFEKLPWANFIVKNEGELAWVEILKKYPNKNIVFPGLLINDNGKPIDTGPAKRLQDVNQIPSPYLTGIFDSIVADNPNISWSSTLETVRGCPYACTFCDTGNEIYNKVKQFELSRVLEEIDWMGQNCSYISVADANFGMFADRDKIILDKLTDVQKKYQKVDNVGITWAKNKNSKLLELMKNYHLETQTIGQGLTLSVQDMNEGVLEIIERKNLNEHKLKEMFNWCIKNELPFYTELILGLPGQTPTSWKNNLWQLFAAGNHRGINIHQCEVIENTNLNKFQTALYKIKTASVSDYFSNTADQIDNIRESTKIVIETRDFSYKDMLDIWVWNSFIQTFHINGITTNIARYLNLKYNVSYEEFYNTFYDYLHTDSWWSSQFNIDRQLYYDWVIDGHINDYEISGVKIPGWNLHNRLTMIIHANQLLKEVFVLIKQFLEKYYNIDYLNQLIEFQQDCIIDFSMLKKYPIKKTAEVDFYGFINQGNDLKNQVVYLIDTPENKNMSFQTFLENFYFGRKRLFGSTKLKKIY